MFLLQTRRQTKLHLNKLLSELCTNCGKSIKVFGMKWIRSCLWVSRLKKNLESVPDVADVEDAAMIAVGAMRAGLIYEDDRRFELQVRLPESLRGNVEALKRLPIKLPTAEIGLPPAYIALGEVVNFEVIEGPNQINRENGKRRVVVTANVRGQDLGTFVNDAQEVIAEQVQIPPGYWVVWGGQFEHDLRDRAAVDRDSYCTWVDFYPAVYHVRKFP